MYLGIFIGLIPFLMGTFFDFSVFLTSVIFLVMILIIFIKNKKLQININNTLLCSTILVIFSLLTTFWAIDKNDAFSGTLRLLSIVIYSIILMQISQKEKENIFKIIPYSGLIMLIISIIIGCIPTLRNFVYSESNRITGFFQYSNTFALYLLIGFIIITNKKIDKKSEIIIPITLLIGILMTGSRTTFIITTLYIIYICIRKENKYRKIYGITYIAILILIGIYTIITQNMSSIGRIFTVSLNSSTLLGRILYWKDGLKLLFENIFGYGYMGYSYKIYEIQTGMYYTKFIHNDYLQIALDIGIIPLCVFICFLIKSIFSKINEKQNKIILIIIMIHMFLEFDLQFMVIFYILMMCLEDKTYKKFEIKTNIITYILIAIFIFVYIYYTITYFMSYIGKDEIAKNMLKNYTESKVDLMLNTENLNIANKYAEEILENNEYVSEAYNLKSVYCLQNSEFNKMIDYKKKEISLNKYNAEVYEEYIHMLSQIMQFYAEKQNRDKIVEYAKYIVEVEDMIEDVENNTSKLAYKLQDSSEIILNETTQNYINEIREIINEK